MSQPPPEAEDGSQHPTLRQDVQHASRQLIVGTALSGSAVLAQRGASVVLFLLLARLVDPSDLGAISYALAVYVTASVFADLGVSTSLPRFAPGDKRAGALAVHGLALRSIVSLGLAVAIWGADAATGVMRGLGAAIAFLVACSIFSVAPYILDSSLCFRAASLTRISIGIGWLAGALVMVKLGLPVWGPLVALGLAMVLAGLPTCWRSITSYRGGLDPALFGHLAAFGMRVMGILCLTTITSQAGLLILTYAVGENSAAVYRLALTLAALPLLAAAAVGDPLQPLVARANRSHGLAAARGLIEPVLAQLLAMAGLMVALALLFAPTLVAVFLPSGYSDAASLVVVLVAANALGMVNSVASSVLYALADMRLLLRANALAAATAVVGTWVFLGPLGNLSAGVALLAANLILVMQLGNWLRYFLRGGAGGAAIWRSLGFGAAGPVVASLLVGTSITQRSAAGLLILVVYGGLVVSIARPAWLCRGGPWRSCAHSTRTAE